MGLEVGNLDLKVVETGRVVQFCSDLNVVNLAAQVRLALAKEESTGQPMDMGVLQVVGGKRPSGSPADEPDKLLAAIEVVDDGGDRFAGVARGDSELGDLLGGTRVGDAGRDVPEAARRDCGLSKEVLGGFCRYKISRLTP